MNLPNKLTVSRFLLTVGFLAVIFSEIPYHESLALLLFSAASLTDYFDGMIARRDKLITNFGILMDPLADKILVCSAFNHHHPVGHPAAPDEGNKSGADQDLIGERVHQDAEISDEFVAPRDHAVEVISQAGGGEEQQREAFVIGNFGKDHGQKPHRQEEAGYG